MTTVELEPEQEERLAEITDELEILARELIQQDALIEPHVTNANLAEEYRGVRESQGLVTRMRTRIKRLQRRRSSIRGNSVSERDARSTGQQRRWHSDVVGKITPTSKGGSSYFVTFIDDYSRYTVVYPMKAKSEVLQKFDEYRRMVENLHNTKVKTLRSDNGAEYTSKEFDEYLAKNGIRRQLTIPGTPEQMEFPRE